MGGILRCARPLTWFVLNLGASTFEEQNLLHVVYNTRIEFPSASCTSSWVSACMAMESVSRQGGPDILADYDSMERLAPLLACALRSPPASREEFESYIRYSQRHETLSHPCPLQGMPKSETVLN